MAHLLKAIQRDRRRTGLGDSLAVHRRNNVLRSSKPKPRRRYFDCAKGVRNLLNSMVRKGLFWFNQRHLQAAGWSNICEASARLDRRERRKLIKGNLAPQEMAVHPYDMV